MSQPLVSRTALDELGAVIGTEKLARLVDRFTDGLDGAFVGDGRADDDFAREAHTLISMSGMLGCEPLSLACRGIEHAVKAGADLAGPLAEVRLLRDRTAAELRSLRAQAGAGV